MSVPNSYSTVMMLMPSLENESYSLTPLVVLIACSSGVVTLRSTSPGEDPGFAVKTVRYGNVRSGISSCLSDEMAKAPKRTTATTARPTIERLRRDIFVSQLTCASTLVGVVRVGTGRRLAARNACQRAIRPGISDSRKLRKSLSSCSCT